MNIHKLISTGLIVLLSLPLTAQTDSQWRGPHRDGHYPENGLLRSWPDQGPALKWSANGLHGGYAAPAVTADAIYVTGRRDSVELITALDLQGRQKWQLVYGTAPVRSYQETRSTPTVQGDRLYVISGLGDIVCINTTHQSIEWRVNGLEAFNGEYGRWEVSESPLIVDDKLIYTPGGNQTTMVALDKMSGRTVWTSPSLNDPTAYVSPICIERGGLKIIIGATDQFLFGVNAENGEMLWKTNFRNLTQPAGSINCNTPIYHDGRIFFTSGYDHLGAMYTLSPDGRSVELVWTNHDLDTHHGHVVLVDGYIYGSNWINNRKGNWLCVDWETGKTLYETEWQTKGSIVTADGMLYCYDEKNGNLALVNATPEGFDVVSSFEIKLGDDWHWGHPVISEGLLYIRHGDCLMAYDIKAGG